jgi:hypothetical protein
MGYTRRPHKPASRPVSGARPVTSWLATPAPDLILMRIGALKGEQLRAVESCLCATLEL